MIGAEETVRVRYRHDEPDVESERRLPRARSQQRRGAAPKRDVGERLSKSKREDRQRRQRVIRRRRTAYALLAALVLVAVGWGIVRLVHSSALALEKVVVTGTAHTDKARVEALAGLTKQETSLLLISPRKVEQRLLSDPWIESVKIHRSLPHTLVIAIRERTPVAVVDGGGNSLWVIAADGHWLSKRSAEDTGLVLIQDVPDFKPVPGKIAREPEIANAVRVITGLSRELLATVAMVSAPSVYETELRTTDDVEIFIGEAEKMPEKDRLIREILARQKEAVVYINVRNPSLPTWRGLK